MLNGLRLLLSLCIQAVSDYSAVAPDLVVSTIPLAVLIIFGSQTVSEDNPTSLFCFLPQNIQLTVRGFQDVLLAWRSLILAIPRRLFGLSSSSTSHIHEARGLRASDCDDSHPTIGARRWRHPNPSSTPHISDFLDSLESSRWRVARRAQALTQRYGSKGKVSSDPYPTTQRNVLTSPALGDFTEPQHIAMPSTNPRRHSWAVDEPAKSPPLVLGVPFVSHGLSSLSPPQKLPSIPPRTLSGPLSPPASRTNL